MQREASRLYNGLQLFQLNSPNVIAMPNQNLPCGFPFEGSTSVHGICLPLPGLTSNSPPRWLMLRIERCTAPFPFEQVIVDRDNNSIPGENAEDETLIPAWVKDERNGQPVEKQSPDTFRSDEVPLVAVHVSSFRFDNALESFDSIRIAIGPRNQSGPEVGLHGTRLGRSSGGLARRPMAHFSCPPRLLRFVFGSLLQSAHLLDGLENQDLVNSGITGLPQTLFGRLNLPPACGRPGSITIWDRDVAVVIVGVSEIGFPHVARIDPKCELARMLEVFRIAHMNPRPQRIVPEVNVGDHDAVFLNCALLERHEIEHERHRFGNAIRQAYSGAIIASQNLFLVSRQRNCFYALVERVGIYVGDVNSEPFFQFGAVKMARPSKS
jgi:hypothetical protein